jgi:F420-dependent oxidoreductase-like protein
MGDQRTGPGSASLGASVGSCSVNGSSAGPWGKQGHHQHYGNRCPVPVPDPRRLPRHVPSRETSVRLGLQLRYLGVGRRQEQAELAREAERLGYASVWASESYGSDAATVLAWLAAQTTSLGIGAAVFQMPARSPAMTAMTAATLDQLSGGRMLLGVGSSGPQVSEGWHGVRFPPQLQRTREYVAVVRMALARERLEFHGQTVELPLPDGPGKALKLTIAPVQGHVPIYLAAIGPNNTELAGEIADGWLPTLLMPELIGEMRGHLATGAARAGRSLDGFDVAPHAEVRIEDDRAAARDHVRPAASLYVGGMGPAGKNFYNNLMSRSGFPDAARAVQELYLAGHKEQAAAALPDDYLDRIALVGPSDVVRERLRVYAAAGVGTLGVTPLAADHAGRLEQLRRLMAVAEDLL